MKINHLIVRLRTKLSSATYGTPARIAGASDYDAVLKGSKFTAPMAFVVLDNTVVRNKTESGSNIQIQEITERINIIVALNSKPDTLGKDPQSLVHDIRLDILKALYGLHPFIMDNRASLDYGYCTKSFTYAGDRFLQMHNEWYAHQFDFDLVSDINQDEQGIGCVDPEDEGVPLELIHADVEPSVITPTEQPAIEINAETA